MLKKKVVRRVGGIMLKKARPTGKGAYGLDMSGRFVSVCCTDTACALQLVKTVALLEIVYQTRCIGAKGMGWSLML